MIISILIGIILVLLYYIFRYKTSVAQLSKQIEEKINLDSKVRIKVDFGVKELEELSQNIEDLFSEITRTQYLARQEKKTLDMAISNIAHDIRTPLAISRGYAQQLTRKGQIDKDVLQKIEDNLVIVSKRLELLLEYRRLLEGAINPTIEKVNLTEIISRQIFSIYDSLNENNFAVDINMEEVTVNSDKEILERIIQNIIGNILKHGKEKVSISLKKIQGITLLEVKNVSKNKIEHIDQLTNRFYSENLASSEESSGLGLYIVEQLVNVLKAELSLAYSDNIFSVMIKFT